MKIIREYSVNENLMRDDTKKRMQKLYNTIKKAGGDIGEKVSKSEKSRENKMANVYYMNNPFDGVRTIDTYEGFCDKKVNEDRHYEKSLEDMYTSTDGKGKVGPGINTTDDRWIKGTPEDKLRPMFNNHPDIKDRLSADILRVGKIINIGDVAGRINSIKNGIVEIDVMGENDKHEIIEYKIADLLKKSAKFNSKDNVLEALNTEEGFNTENEQYALEFNNPIFLKKVDDEENIENSYLTLNSAEPQIAKEISAKLINDFNTENIEENIDDFDDVKILSVKILYVNKERSQFTVQVVIVGYPTEYFIAYIKEKLEDQFSDGWGEGFEKHPIGGYFVKTWLINNTEIEFIDFEKVK